MFIKSLSIVTGKVRPVLNLPKGWDPFTCSLSTPVQGENTILDSFIEINLTLHGGIIPTGPFTH